MDSYDSKPIVKAAIEYACMGWHVFPVRSKDGNPYYVTDKNTGDKIKVVPRAKSPLTKGGFKSSTTDIKKVESWWSKYPSAGIGIDCGKSKIFVIDIDNKIKNGIEVRGFQNFVKLGVPYLNTWKASTPTNGMHLIYSDPAGIGKSHTNETLGIDTRGVGGYIVAPHSFIIMPDGTKRRYLRQGEWLGRPMEITQHILDKLPFKKEDSYAKKDKNRDGYTEENLRKIKYYMSNMPVEAAWNREHWVIIGSALKNYGDEGYKMFIDWTNKYFEDKPNSKRRSQVNYQWNSFNGAPDIGSIIMIYKEYK